LTPVTCATTCRNRASIVQAAAGSRLVALVGDTAWVFDLSG
jgi:hypothetical protein